MSCFLFTFLILTLPYISIVPALPLRVSLYPHALALCHQRLEREGGHLCTFVRTSCKMSVLKYLRVLYHSCYIFPSAWGMEYNLFRTSVSAVLQF